MKMHGQKNVKKRKGLEKSSAFIVNVTGYNVSTQIMETTIFSEMPAHFKRPTRH
jgi:hypothetical protein